MTQSFVIKVATNEAATLERWLIDKFVYCLDCGSYFQDGYARRVGQQLTGYCFDCREDDQGSVTQVEA